MPGEEVAAGPWQGAAAGEDGGARPEGWGNLAFLDFNEARLRALLEDDIPRLKARVDLVDVARRYGDLKEYRRNGRAEWWGCCPFHKEKTPSFKINPERQSFYCFGCKA